MDRIGIVGTGVMGLAMAGHLLEAGYEVHGFDVVPEKTEELTRIGGISESSGTHLAKRSDVLLLSLPSVAALEAATSDIARGAHDGLLALEMGTLPIEAKQQSRQALAAVGVELMDVPVSGTGLQAADASLVIFASGSPAAFERVAPILSVIGRSTHFMGDFGNGSIMKYIANLLVAIHNLSSAEAHALGIAAGMDPEVVQRVMSDGVGASKIFDIRGPMMVADVYDPPAARLSILLKDTRIIKAFAEEVGAPTPLLDAAIPVYEQSEAQGLGDLDAAALCRYLEQRAGLQRPPKRHQ